MADAIERKRLKKKMLDRWENEGGRIGAEPPASDDPGPPGEPQGKGKQRSGSRVNPTIGGPSSPTMRRKATRK